MEVACNIEDHLAHQPEPRGACFRRGFLAALAYVREQEPSDAIKALEKIEARAGDRPPYSQMALDMWTIARAALKAARER